MKPAPVWITLFLFVSVHSAAQTWRSTLYPDTKTPAAPALFYSDKMIQDFSVAGYHRGEQALPFSKKGIIDVSKPPYRADRSGKQDVTAGLQRAIDDAGRRGGGVVYLPAGTYRLSVAAGKNYCLRMDQSRVVLRGAGTGKTFLFNTATDMRGKAILRVGGDASWTSAASGAVRITQDLPHPTVVIPVANTASFKKGDVVLLRNAINNDWIEAHGMLPYWKDKGTSLGGLLYCRQVVSVDPVKKVLTIDRPIR